MQFPKNWPKTIDGTLPLFNFCSGDLPLACADAEIPFSPPNHGGGDMADVVWRLSLTNIPFEFLRIVDGLGHD